MHCIPQIIFMTDHDSEDGYVEHIAPHVIRALEKLNFFERLDDHLCPSETPEKIVPCIAHSFAITTKILQDSGMDSDDIADVLAVLRSRGGCCDCEILYNVAEHSRLKEKYWKARAAELQPRSSDPSA
jgi:Protein of unknown function (DUF2695)